MRILFFLSLLLIVISFVHAAMTRRPDVKRSIREVKSREAVDGWPRGRFRRDHEKREKRAYPHH